MIWITDFYDGALGATDKEALDSFLELHPDLKDEFLIFNELNLHPEIAVRMDKDSLHKSITDLDPELTAEEYDILSSDYGSVKELEESASLVLIPEEIEYPAKKKLKRIPLLARTFKIAIRFTSAAASIAILLSLFILLPNRHRITESYTMASMLPFNSQTIEPASSRLTNQLRHSRIKPKQIVIKESIVQKEELVPRQQEIYIAHTALNNTILFAEAINNSAAPVLVSMQEIDVPIDQPNLSPRQFLALNFRKHLLKENVDNTENLKVYEVADVSINGLNKLLGWEMKFESETNMEGHLTSYKFNSQLIKLDRKTKVAND